MFKNVDDTSNYFKSLGLSVECLQMTTRIVTCGYTKSSSTTYSKNLKITMTRRLISTVTA